MPALLVPASADTTRLSNSLVKLLKSELSVSEAAIGVVLAFSGSNDSGVSFDAPRNRLL